MPKKKKKGANKEKKVKKKPWLNERETVSYEQQILDNNKQLARLGTRNEHLESEVDALNAKLTQLETDRSDVVAHLKRILQQKTEEASELSDRLLAIEELRKEEHIANKNKEDSMQLEYHTMETNLSAEVKLAVGKLNALEDWRLARIELTRKFEIQEENIAQQEKRHEEMIYAAEKALTIGKSKMQNEMEERLNGLAQSFREATNIRIADTTHRAVRENVALNLELDAMYEFCRKLNSTIKEYKEKEDNLRLNSAITQSQAKMAMNKMLEQNRLIENLAEEHYNMSILHGKICREEAYKATKEEIVQMYKNKSVETQQRARMLEKKIEKAQNEREEILKEIDENCRQVKRLKSVLDTAKRYINKIAQFPDKITVEDTCACCNHDFEDKLRVLMDILDEQKMIEPSIVDDSSVSLEGEYSNGSHRVEPKNSTSSVLPIENETGTDQLLVVDESEEMLEKPQETSMSQNDDYYNNFSIDSPRSVSSSPEAIDAPGAKSSEDET